MTPDESIKALLAGAAQPAVEDDRAAARLAARIIWVRNVMARLKTAQKKVDDAWTRRLDAMPDDLDDDEYENLPDPPEQAELDAILAEIEAVKDHDRWPRELYWGDV